MSQHPSGKRRRTTYPLTVEEARERYVDPEPVPNSPEVLSQCDEDVSPVESWRSVPADNVAENRTVVDFPSRASCRRSASAFRMTSSPARYCFQQQPNGRGATINAVWIPVRFARTIGAYATRMRPPTTWHG